ncbi:MAG TPA: hypothetical protein VI141_06555, partial [Acidimicrobiia bacterium]
MRRLLTALALLVAACSPGETADSTTTPSTSVPVDTTTGATTATTAPTTTTTTVPTTTTTFPPTTTTIADLEGNWADGPLVTTDFVALGWWDGSEWLDAETEGAIPVVGGEDYQVVVGDTLSRTTAGPQTLVCEPLDLIGVQLADPDLLGDFPGPYGVAISAPWPLQPHLYVEEADDGSFGAVAAELLSSRGLDVASPIIKQVVRTDLEGDGVNEILVVAEDVSPGFIFEPGDYSILFMRKVVDGVVQTAVLEESVATGDDLFGGAYLVGTVADLNGD